MKRKYFYGLALFFAILVQINAQQITTDSSLSLEALIENNLAEGCVDISNISSSVNGNVIGLPSYGSFDRADSNFPFQNGIMLCTGNINSAGNILNTSPLNEGDDTWLTDSDLENALGISGTINATSIEFDFISVANQIQFNYLLASEEYLGTNPCSYSDGFAFLIREAESSGPFTNIALIPGTTIPVNTNTIHDEIVGFCPESNSAYFEGYNIGDTNYNGRTTVLTATASIQPNVQYRIKLVIADQVDEFYDSAVFIEGNSFNAAVDLGPDIVTCAQTADLDGNIENTLATYEWFQNGTPITGETAPTLQVTASGTYTVEIRIPLDETFCVIEDDVIVTLNSEQSLGNLTDYLLCDDISGDGVETFILNTKDNEVLSSLPSSSYNITYYLTEEDAQNGDNPLPNNYQNTSSPQQIFVKSEDLNNGCLAFTSFNLVVNQLPEINEPSEIIVCDDGVSDGFTLIDLSETSNEVNGGNSNQYVSYHYTQQDANTGANPLFSPYSNINPNETLYIRVFDVTTGCVNTTSVDISVLDNPMVNAEDHWINGCELDEDGFEEFDLLSVVEDVLEGLTGVTVTFHEIYNDAETGENPIANPDNYQNVIPEFQIIFIRIVDDSTGCFSVVPVELHSNIVETGFITGDFSVCDDVSGDGTANFNLNEVQSTLVNGYEGFTIIFYETLNDLENAQNPLNSSTPYPVTSSPTTLYVAVIEGDCIQTTTIDLVINEATELGDLGTVDYCDENSDGFTTIFLETFNTYVSTGVNGANVKYYLTEQDALNNENILPPYYYNTANPQVVWVRVTNSVSDCFDVAPLTINISAAPQANYASDIIICDDDSDGIFTVNLENKIPEIVADPTDLNITFYNDYNNAFIGENEINTPSNYDTFSQYIYVRVENANTNCFTVVWFYVYINTLPEFIPITNFENCEADGNNIADFFFYLKDTEILNGQTGKNVLYFETAQDAIDRTNIINKYSAYQNISNPQTMHVRVENYSDIECFGTSQFDLEVGSLPLYNEPSDIFVCDDISNDGIESFDLNDQILEISNNISETLNISFHPSQYEADYDLNELPLDFTTFNNPQQVFARIENGTYCHAVAGFIINIIQVPEVMTPSDLIQCDTDYDGIVTFNLTDVEVEILDVRQDDIVITYHESQIGADTDTDVILDPENYTNTSNPQTVFVKINNTVSNCYVTLPFDLIVNLPPTFIDFQTYEICDNAQSAFDLTSIDSEVTDDTGLLISYFSSLTDAQNNTNVLDTNYTYASTNDSIYIRLENAVTGCFATYNFDLLVNPSPIANIPDTVLACDDVSNDGVEIIDLSLQNAQVLGSQSETMFTVTYHNSEASANNADASLDMNYSASNNEVIFVRVENNVTGCYAITQFDVIIYEHPQPTQPIILCDEDYDEITVFNLTSSENDLYATTPPYISFTYFESEQDLEGDINPILNPTNYTNTSNPQTIYIKAYNALADCYSNVPLELIINLAPAINEFETYEICDNPTSSFDLNTIDNVIVNDTTDVIFSYYTSLSDAQSAINALTTEYTYSTTNDLIYIRVEFGTTGCFYVYPFELVINPLPIANQPDALQACDDPSNDDVGNFNLFSQTNSILGNQSANDFSVTYYLTEADAESATNELPNDYTGPANETIYVRVENNETGCFSLTDFNLVVNEHPNTPNQIFNCDDNYDGITTFDLTQIEPELFDIVNPDNVITYFESLSDLELDTNVISTPGDFTNSSNPQTLFVKVYNTVADCFQYVSFDIHVNLPPEINPINEFEICENENGTTLLSDINAQLLVQTVNALVVYYESEADAINQVNPLDNDYAYLPGTTTLYARVAFSTTQCFYIHDFNLIVNPLPTANALQPIEACDDDFDGLYTFDLTQQNNVLLGNQNPNNFTISYFISLEDANENIDVLPTDYTSASFETIYARIENNTTGCYSITEFTTVVWRKPMVDIPDQVICLEDLPLIVSANTNEEGDTYLWSTTEVTPEIEITEIGTYSVAVTSMFGCTTTRVFSVTESQAAIIEIVETVDFSDPNNITITVNGIGNYLYQLDDNPPQVSNVFENVAIGYHTVTVIDLNGCTEVTKDVVVIDVPKFVTPNGDGYFDTWHITGVESLPGTIVYIFDRYGKLLTTLAHDSIGWNGIYNGHLMPASDYWFLAKVKKDDTAFEIKGHFTLRL